MRAEIDNWNSLQDINDAQASAREASAELLGELRQVLIRRGVIEKFGICLLHKHFDVDADEVLLETSDSAAKVLTIKPIKKIPIQKSRLPFPRFGLWEAKSRRLRNVEWSAFVTRTAFTKRRIGRDPRLGRVQYRQEFYA